MINEFKDFNTNFNKKINMVNDIQILKSDIVKMLKTVEPDMSFMEAVRPIRESVSLEEIMAEQNYKPISYEEFRAKADEIEWFRGIT